MKRRALVNAPFVVAIVFATCGSACRGLVGIEDDPPTELAPAPTPPPTSPPPPPPVCGGYSYAQPKCATCANSKCCSDATACMESSECPLLAECEHECKPDDAECLLRCELAHPDGVSRQRALAACVSSECSASCVPARWACLDPPQKEVVATAPPIKVTYRVIEFPLLYRVEGMTIGECLEGGDPDCLSPVRTVPTNVSGEATFDIGSNVSEKRVVISKKGYVTSMVYLPRLTQSFVATIGVAPEPVLDSVARQITGAPPIAGRGHVLVNLLDCLSGFGGGVKLGLDAPPGFTPFYFANGEPAPVSERVQATDANPKTGAYGGFVNVSPGFVEISATVAENGLPYARLDPEGKVVDRRRVVVSKDRITFVLLHAKPQ